MRPAVAILALLLSAHAAGGADLHFPDPPRLAIPGDVSEAQRQQQIVRGEALLKQGLAVPAGPGNWEFYYANPKTGGALKALSPTEHQDPATGEIFRDEKIVAAYRSVLHNRLNRETLEVAWAYARSNDDRFAAAVRDVLLKLAADYGAYPWRWDRWGRTGVLATIGGRRYCQSLSEAVGVIPLCHAYDLVRRSSVWTDAQREQVEQQFFAATRNTLRWWNAGLSNHQTWWNAGLLAIANVLGDGRLVRDVMNRKGGFHDQMKNAVGDDGFWWEGTISYHYYALQALMEMATAVKPLGVDLTDDVRFRSMFDVAAKLAYPDGRLPALNDGDPARLASYRPFAQWLAQQRGDAAADLSPATHSVDMSTLGLAILRAGAGQQQACAMLDYGPHGGGHGHFDKLQLILYAGGREWLLDPGRLTYSHPQYQTWVKHTAAHNTVAINGVSQAGTTGQRLWFDPDPQRPSCGAECSSAYPGVMLRRQLLLTPEYLLDLYDVRASRDGTIDWFAHAVGDEVVWPEGTPLTPVTLGDRDGYPHLENPQAGPAAASGQWTFRSGDGASLRCWYADSTATQPVATRGIGYRVDQRTPTVVRRVTARAATFVTVYDWSGQVQFMRVPTTGDGATVVEVERVGGTSQAWRFDAGAAPVLIAR